MGLPESSGIELYSMWKKGKRNIITDVPGVKVGNVTLREGAANTGITAILPHPGNLFQNKVMGAAAVLNGFGKSAGLVQLEELGTIETPIIMTNTFGVGTAVNALTKFMLAENRDIGTSTGTVNCLVTECNDGRINDIRGMHIREEHVFEALKCAGEEFEEGAVGGGTGMVCLGLKGGIGSASRIVETDGRAYTVGAIVMSNFGSLRNLTIGGRHIGKEIKDKSGIEKDQGSIIIVIGTDVPANERQLRRIAKRASIALARTGSCLGNGSGDIAIAFTTENQVPHYSSTNVLNTKMFYDENLDMIFEAAAEATEEAIISSMYHAEATQGIGGKIYRSLREYL